MVPLTKELTPISPSTSREFGFVTKDGIYQRMTLLYGSLAAFVMAANNMMPLVASPGVNHWCAPPDGVQVSEEDWKNMSIPVDEDGKYSQCQMLNGTDNSSVVACTKWQYESSRHFGTIVEEYRPDASGHGQLHRGDCVLHLHRQRRQHRPLYCASLLRGKCSECPHTPSLRATYRSGGSVEPRVVWHHHSGRLRCGYSLCPRSPECEYWLAPLPTVAHGADNDARLRITEEEKYSEMLRVELLSVLLAPSLRRTNVILFYSWFTVSLTYYGIHVYMMMNPSTTMMVTLLTFLPIAMLTYCGMECLGRTRTLTCAMFLSTFSCLLDVFFRGDEGSAVSAALTDTLEVLGITVAQTVVVLVIAEVNPTAVRTIAVCCGFVCSRSGMICAALAQHLWTLPSVGPPVLYGVFCLVAGILVTFVPETKAARLPEAVKKFNMFEIAPLPLGRKSHRRKAEARSPRHSPVHVARRSLEPVLSKLVEIYGSETTTLSSYGISDVLLDIRDVIQKSSDTNHSAL
ncbi:solute carrier family 22 member 6-like isoform X2 [Ornithodoros turicata]|uniref:solute carrier family 22 member 6-like isoform X2 n=1 Tax=Ornithodoros turicata TaxID=34597 RepID=UPI00313A1A42